MEAEPISPRKLAQNYVSAEPPLTVPQKLQIPAPDLEVYPGSGNSVKQALAARFPPAQKANGTSPARVLRGQRTVDFITISERHIDNRLADSIVLIPLI